MSRSHSPSEFPGRTFGPCYCLFCGSDWPCAGSRAEDADADTRAAFKRAELESMYDAICAGREAGAVAAERTRLVAAVEGMPEARTVTGSYYDRIDRAVVLALIRDTEGGTE